MRGVQRLVDFKLTPGLRNVGFSRMFSQIHKIWAVATIALTAVAAFAGPDYAQKRELLATKTRPEDFVDLKSVAPSIVVDIRYAGPHNFVGRAIPGYDADKCLVTRRAAEAVASVQQKLTTFGLSLLVYDCYRPQRGGDYFVKWAAGSSDNSMKREFYPHVKKDNLFKDGYIASPSSHSRGSTVDLTIVPLLRSNIGVYAPGDPLTACDEQAPSRFRDGSLDMGTGYDCFDPRAHLMASGLTSQQRANRMLLATLMGQAGFAGYGNEWWHFTLRNEPYPNTYFDFPIR
jgi:D-alanyl-D-alanine dipeptidase